MAYIHMYMYPTVMLLNFSFGSPIMHGGTATDTCMYLLLWYIQLLQNLMQIELTTHSCDLKSPVGLGHNLQIDSKSNVPSTRGGLC